MKDHNNKFCAARDKNQPNYEEQAAAYRESTNPLGESSFSPQQDLVKRITGMIHDVLMAVRKRQEQIGPYGNDVPTGLGARDTAEWWHDTKERESNNGPDGVKPRITEQGDRTFRFQPGDRVRMRDRYRERGIGRVVSSESGLTIVDWGDGEEETYNSWELVATKPMADEKVFADGDVSKTGL